MLTSCSSALPIWGPYSCFFLKTIIILPVPPVITNSPCNAARCVVCHRSKQLFVRQTELINFLIRTNNKKNNSYSLFALIVIV